MSTLTYVTRQLVMYAASTYLKLRHALGPKGYRSCPGLLSAGTDLGGALRGRSDISEYARFFFFSGGRPSGTTRG